MNIVLFESGRGLPEYLECCLKQIRVFNPDVSIYILVDIQNVNDPLFKKYNVNSFNKDDFKFPVNIKSNFANKIDSLHRLYCKAADDFWMITTTRLVYIENFILANKLQDVYHFESDVLLYYDLKQHHCSFQKLYKHLAITVAGSIWAMTGFLYIKDAESLQLMTCFFTDILSTYRRTGIGSKFNWGVKHQKVNEMKLMKLYADLKGDEYLSFLPILPFGKYSENYNIFNSIFDSVVFGSFIGGVKELKTPGFILSHLFVGELLLNNPEYKVIWQKDKLKRKVPYFKYNDNKVKINNLYIHSKDLQLYTS